MQLVDGNLHGCFRVHLRAHVEEHTPLNYTSRHVCDRFGFLFRFSWRYIRIRFVVSYDALNRCYCLSCGAVSVFEYRRLLQATVWYYFCHQLLFQLLASWRHLTRVCIGKWVAAQIVWCLPVQYEELRPPTQIKIHRGKKHPLSRTDVCNSGLRIQKGITTPGEFFFLMLLCKTDGCLAPGQC